MRASETSSTLPEPASPSTVQPRKRILFRVLSANADIASVRYRAMYPAIGLRDLGFKCVVSDRELSDDTLRHYHCIVFVKAFRFSDLAVALRAKMLGIPIVLDICDNIFVQDYGPGVGNEMAVAFKIMAESASAIITTGPALTSVIRQQIKNPPPIVEICDPLETRHLLALSRKQFRTSRPPFIPRAQNALRLLIGHPPQFAKLLVKKFRSALFNRRFYVTEIFRVCVLAPSSAVKKLIGRITRTKSLAAVREAEPGADHHALKTLLWFGNHGAPYGDFGMLTLLPILPAIVRVAKKIPLRLIIVSNSEEKYRRHFSNLPFLTKYREWSPASIFDEIEAADVCLIPNSRDLFSLTKSSNRAILSLYYGTPVVATDIPALEDIKHCIITDDWENGILTYLLDPQRAKRDISAARTVVEQKYSLRVVAPHWADLLRTVTAGPIAPVAIKDRPGILIMLCGALSADALISTFNRLKTDPSRDVNLWVATEAIIEAPRIIDMVDATSTNLFFGTRKVLGDAVRPLLNSLDTILIAAEELSWPSVAQAVRTAQQHNVFVCAMQSGLDAPSQAAHAGSDVTPDCVLTWGPKQARAATAETARPRIEISIGCPRAIVSATADASHPLYGQSYLAVVEDVYRSDSPDRRLIAARIGTILEAFPDLHIVFVPRSAQVTAARSHFTPEQRQRITVVDLDAKKNEFYLPRVLANAAMVIAESSTIALDAARADRPVAMMSLGTTPPEDEPLPVLNSTEEWTKFVGDVIAGRDDSQPRRSFVSQIAGLTDPTDQIVAVLKRRHCSTPRSGVAGSASAI